MIMKEKKKYFASQVCRSLMKRIEMKSHFQGKLPITAVAPKVASEEKLIWIIIINVLIWIKSTTAHFYIQLWNSSPKQPSLIILSQPTYTRASLAQNRWFCGNKGFRFVHLTINSGRPQQHSKKSFSDKVWGRTPLNKSFLSHFGGFLFHCVLCLGFITLSGRSTVRERLYVPKVAIPRARAEQQPHYCSAICTKSMLPSFSKL